MSHFAVLVIGDDVEGQLRPYQENNMGDCPGEFLEFHDIEDEYRKKYETECGSMVKLASGELVCAYDNRFRNPDFLNGPHWVYPEGAVEVQVPHSARYPTFEEFMREYCGDGGRDPSKGRYGYWENPNSKWDWYLVGGRWTGFFKLKDGANGSHGEPGLMTDPPEAGTADIVKLGDLAEPPRRTFAVVKDGKWYERGRMGWWAMVSDEKAEEAWESEFHNLLDGLPEDTTLTIVDCHI